MTASWRVAAPEEAKPKEEIDLSAYQDGDVSCEVVYVEPARLSAFAIAIEQALGAEGISQAELARRMKVPASVASPTRSPSGIPARRSAASQTPSVGISA